jgi:hypothetical protein
MSMSEGFATIDMFALELVCGGEGEQNIEEGSGNIGVTAPTKKGGTIQVGIQGSGRRTRSNYAVCVQEYVRAGGNAAGIRAACGLPNGQP